MKSLFPIALLLMIMSIGSCGEKKKSEQDLLYDKVIEIHDEIMPLMGDIMKYKSQLDGKLDTLVAAGIEGNEEAITTYKKSVDDLEKSHEEMMDWMHQFDTDFEGKTEKEIMDYLNEQKSKIEQVGKTTSEALTNAENLLNK